VAPFIGRLFSGCSLSKLHYYLIEADRVAAISVEMVW
jgi:hypothetical protein